MSAATAQAPGAGKGLLLAALAAPGALVLSLLLMGPTVLLGALMSDSCDGSSPSSTNVTAVSGDLGDMPFVGMDNAAIDAKWFGGQAGRHGECAAYPVGQCTRWACERRSMLGMPVGPYWGNGGAWGASARGLGLPTSTTPVAGAAVAFAPGQDGADGFYGHIAIVEKVDTKAGTILISEMNVAGPIVSTRTLPLSTPRDYILPSVSPDSGWPADEMEAARKALSDKESKKDDDSTKDEKDSKKEDSKDKNKDTKKGDSKSKDTGKKDKDSKDSGEASTVQASVTPSSVAGSCSSSSSSVRRASTGGDGTVAIEPYKGKVDGWHASPEDARQIGWEMVEREWPDDADREFDCLDTIVRAESGWQWNATNPSSGAYGIPQSLPASKLASAGSDWEGDAATQIRWMLDYIRNQRGWEYGTPCKALQVRDTRGWY